MWRLGRELVRALLVALVIACASGGGGAGCGSGSRSGAHDAAAGPGGDTGADDAGAGRGGGGGASGGGVDCKASCDRIAATCEGMSTIDANWLSICRQNCEVRLAVMPETAEAEVACVAAATDCATAVLCSVSPTGGDR